MFRQLWIDLRVRLSALFGRRTLNARALEEMEFHLEMREKQLRERGIPLSEARSQARREFGNSLLLQEAALDMWKYAPLKNLLHDIGCDVRYAARWLVRTPVFTAAAIVTIALGVGVNAGLFTVLNGVLFRDLPAPDSRELVSIVQSVSGGEDHLARDIFSLSEYVAYRDRTQTLSGVIAMARARGGTTLGGETPQKILGNLVSCNYFAVLKQPPVLGRGLEGPDCAPGANPVIVIGHHLWRTAFAGDHGIVGRTVELSRQRFTIVGVAAEGTYSDPIGIGYFAPLSADGLVGGRRFENERTPWLDLIGRRQENASLDQVRAELAVIAAQLDQQQPGRTTTLLIEQAKALTPSNRARATGAAAVLMTAFGFILLIACANVANLLLARGSARSQEIGIRRSLGASRARVVRQLLTESMLLSLAGGLLGSVVAVWSFQGLVPRIVPTLMPALVGDLSPDFRVLLFAVTLTVGTGLLFGLAPALHLSNPDLHGAIKQGAAGGSVSRAGGRLRGALVGLQVALCMTLMIAAGLLSRGLYTTYTADPGFAYRDVAYANFEELASEGYEAAQAEELQRRLLENVAAIPGVVEVATVQREPLGDDVGGIRIRLPDQAENESHAAEMNVVSAGYFSLVEIPILRGRTFRQAEVADAQGGIGSGPVIVSEATALNFWPGADPIGQALRQGENTLRVVGVAADVQVMTIGHVPPYYVYFPGQGGLLFFKSRTDLGATMSSVRAAVRALDPGLVVNVLPLESTLGYWRGLSRTVTGIGAGLGILALLLAAVGIYGVVSYSVRKRYREIGIRIALGAGTGNVLRTILGQTMRPVVIGAVIGAAAATAVSSILSSVLFGVSPADPIGLGGGALLALAVAIGAGVIAARPATQADPTTVLRSE
jgi:predicted permease